MSLADTHWETVIGCFNLAIFKEMNQVGLGSASPQKKPENACAKQHSLFSTI